MAKITHLFGDSTRNPKPFGVKLALRKWASIPLCFVLAAAVPLVVVGFSIIYVASRLVHKLTGKYPLNLTLRLGDDAQSL